ncbi:NAD(P)H-hydrate epimerase [Bryocella elongata]|uniref:Bifunctional NAD(P)H-hydrate repair enzyme n=1 Tax=Bryocella elongata TaxID=863522 RepID=A0A1H5WRN3_9BACT|nr:NAD(P)H-hydrate dehydratase [Bryocella elongata]SEG01637.1 NAD(P)H-hydrate epimerase [Bryocella elongata]
MKILSAQDMAAADKRAVEDGTPVATLMHNAGAAVAKFCLRRWPQAGDGGGVIVALCGKGNNGGDGVVAAQELARAGRTVRIALLGAETDVKGDAAAVLGAARKPGGPEFVAISDESELRAALADATLVLDAIVGTGFKPPLRGLAATARDLVAASSVPVVAVDLPSGWDANATTLRQGSADDPASQPFRADAVVTFAAPKLAHVFGFLTVGGSSKPADNFGPVVVADIGIPAAAVQASTGLYWGGSSKAISEVPRSIDGNKGRFGHVLVVGGALGKAGAPAMASLAALRAGAGLVTAAVPREILPTVATIAPELMLTPLAMASDFDGAGLDSSQLLGEPLKAMLMGINVLAVGPGLGQQGETPEFVRTLLERTTLPLVLDADGLNAIAADMDSLREVTEAARREGKPRTIVLTPHPGEMARLTGMSVREVESDRLGIARRFVREYGVTLVLKGWRTLIVSPGGRIALNTSGNPAMSKGGSGDILTGIVAAMLAQYAVDKDGAVPDLNRVAQAVEAAVYLHGLGGDFATLSQDEHTVLATDTVNHLANAFRARLTDEDGFTWITGLAGRNR